MTHPVSFGRLALVGVALAACACDWGRELAAASSVTVKLPPPRPLASAPAFSFQDAMKLRG